MTAADKAAEDLRAGLAHLEDSIPHRPLASGLDVVAWVDAVRRMRPYVERAARRLEGGEPELSGPELAERLRAAIQTAYAIPGGGAGRRYGDEEELRRLAEAACVRLEDAG